MYFHWCFFYVIKITYDGKKIDGIIMFLILRAKDEIFDILLLRYWIVFHFSSVENLKKDWLNILKKSMYSLFVKINISPSDNVNNLES